MIIHAHLPDKFWVEAVEFAAYIRNHTPMSAIQGNKTLLEVWSGRKPDVPHMKMCWCMVYSHVPDAQRQKLDKKAMKLRFAGSSKWCSMSRTLNMEPIESLA